jgi:chemotaxis protein CheX
MERAMALLNEEVAQVTELVWQSVLGLGLTPIRDVAPMPAAEPALAGRVEISGSWEGAVAVHCSRRLATRAAAEMFGLSPEATGPAHTQDALGELANMIGGNLKALLPEPCRLSLPTVIEAAAPDLPAPEDAAVGQATYHCEGEILIVRLLSKSRRDR